MPVDQFNVKKLYPDSVRNPMTWAAGATTDPRFVLSGTLSGVTKNGDVYTFSGNSAARLNIMTTVGYVPSDIVTNHDQIKARGYMQNPKDWRDIEMTAYVKITASTDDQMVMYARGGKHTGDGSCEGFAYKQDLYFSGGTRFAKEQWHVSYEFTSEKPFMGSIEGKWVGMKAVFFNVKDRDAVQLELWVDKNADGNWEKANTFVDAGGFGSEGGLCGTKPDAIGTWGGPIATYRWDSVDTIDMKWMSVREINPYGEFTDGGSNPGGGTGSGGTGETGSGGGTGTGGETGGTGGGGGGTNVDPGGVVCTVSNFSTRIMNTAIGGNVAGDCTKNLYKLTGRTENFTDSGFKTRHYASGKPDDITREWNTRNGVPFANYEFTAYVTIQKQDHDDTISMKMYGPSHDDGVGAWYIVDLTFNSGQFIGGWEEPHPHTILDVNGSSYGSIMNKEIGMKAVIWKVGSGANVVAWIDTGDKIWKKGFEKLNIDGKQYSPDSQQKVQLRIDAAPQLVVRCVTCREITPGGEFVGSTDPVDPPVDPDPNPDPDPPPDPDPIDPGGGGGTECAPNDPNEKEKGTPSGSGGGSQNEPKPIMTVSRDFTFILNSGVDTEDNCTAGNPLEERPYTSIYNVAGDTGVYRDLGYMIIFTQGATEVGEYCSTTSSVLFDKIIRKVVVNGIKRSVNALSQTSTGTLSMHIINFATQQIMVNFGETVNVAGIDVNEQTLEFTQDDNLYRMKVGDMIVLHYQSNDANTDKCLKVRATTKDTFDGINTFLVAKIYDGYLGYWDQDVAFNIFI